jgi:phage gp36-like protein
MAYTVRADLERWAGADNVDKWSSLGTSDSEAVKTARIDAMIASADAEIDARLDDSKYATPLSGGSQVVVDMSARQAVVNLYAARGGQDTGADGQPRNAVSHHKKWVDETIERIIANKLTIPGAAVKSELYEAPH